MPSFPITLSFTLLVVLLTCWLMVTVLIARIAYEAALPSANSASLCEIALYLLARSTFLTELDEEIDGIRYRGAGCALLLSKPLEFGTDRPKAITMECLFRTADGFHFVLKCDFQLLGEHSESKKFWIEPLPLHEARQWALLHAGARDVSHV